MLICVVDDTPLVVDKSNRDNFIAKLSDNGNDRGMALGPHRLCPLKR